MIPFPAPLQTSSTASFLDVQTVTTGATGTAGPEDRRRGFDSASVMGSISDGTSDVYGGSAITSLYWDENVGTWRYVLKIPGAANSGWTTLTIGSLSLLRASATYVSGTWEWATSDGVTSQAFGGAGSTHPCIFT